MAASPRYSEDTTRLDQFDPKLSEDPSLVLRQMMSLERLHNSSESVPRFLHGRFEIDSWLMSSVPMTMFRVWVFSLSTSLKYDANHHLNTGFFNQSSSAKLSSSKGTTSPLSGDIRCLWQTENAEWTRMATTIAMVVSGSQCFRRNWSTSCSLCSCSRNYDITWRSSFHCIFSWRNHWTYWRNHITQWRLKEGWVSLHL